MRRCTFISETNRLGLERQGMPLAFSSLRKRQNELLVEAIQDLLKKYSNKPKK